MKGWFYEALVLGQWRPRWSLDKPVVKDGHIHTYGGGVGPELRNLKPARLDDLDRLARADSEPVFRTRRNPDALMDRG